MVRCVNMLYPPLLSRDQNMSRDRDRDQDISRDEDQDTRDTVSGQS